MVDAGQAHAVGVGHNGDGEPGAAAPQARSLLAAATAAEAEGQLRQAAACFAALLLPPAGAALAAPAHPDDAPAAYEALHGLARLHLAAGRGAEAAAFAEQAAGAAVAGWQLLGDCRLAAGDWQGALAASQEALSLCAEDAAPERQLDLTVACARALRAAPDPLQRQAGASLVLSVLGRTGQRHAGALREYLAVAAEEGAWADVVRVALRLVAADRQDAKAQRWLARGLAEEEGMAALRGDLAGAADRGPALGHLGSIAKRHSALAAARQLFREQAAAEPGATGPPLSLAHVLELSHDYAGVADVAAAACEAQAQAEAGLQLGGLDLREAARMLRGLPPLPGPTSTAWLIPWQPQRLRQQQPQSAESAVDYSAESAVAYSAQQLDLLALLFTAAKALYVGGALGAAAALCELLQPARAASAAPLHTTPARNEAAYFGCVQQLLGSYLPPDPRLPPCRAAAEPAQAADGAGGGSTGQGSASDGTDGGGGGDSEACTRLPPPLYLIGDSHCLTGAWRTVTMRGQRRLLHPLLVTGYKVWHLRPDSDFYPKAQFWAAVDALPRGAQLVLVLGEIDCREGLPLAVERLKYDSLEAALAATLDIYLGLLLQLTDERGLEVWVHPVPPVLDVTRALVAEFQAGLEQRVRGAQAHPRAHARLHLLDFWGSLLGPDGRLRPELALDGTHMAPRAYLPLLEAALVTGGEAAAGAGGGMAVAETREARATAARPGVM